MLSYRRHLELLQSPQCQCSVCNSVSVVPEGVRLCPEDLPCWLLTVLSNPSVSSIRKKMMAKKVEAGMFAMASAYVMKSRLGPGSESWDHC